MHVNVYNVMSNLPYPHKRKEKEVKTKGSVGYLVESHNDWEYEMKKKEIDITPLHAPYLITTRTSHEFPQL